MKFVRVKWIYESVPGKFFFLNNQHDIHMNFLCLLRVKVSCNNKSLNE